MYENISTILSLLGIVAVIAGYLAWREIKEAGDNMADYDARVKAWGEKQAEEDRQEREDHRARLAAYNDTEHEACNDFGSDEYRRRLNAGIANQACASMEPFCGEGKNLTEKEKREELERLNLPGWANVPEHLRPDPYTRMGP